ncbi:Ig-like domain repeat protein, partial [Methanobrevibacter sp.]|uniref:Ig-like domain-containing protein n=1 Tax=Methanobrevibacter sp. TaxID=66852 RepID=UPI00388FE4DA
DTLPGRNVTLTAEINTNEGIIIFKINDKETPVNITNNKATLTIENITEGNYNVTVTYTDPAGNYLTSQANASFKVEKITTELTLENITIDYGETAKLIATLKANNQTLAGKTVTITFNDKETEATTDNNGQVSIDIKDINADTYTATATFKGDNDYTPSNATATVTIKQVATKTTITGATDINVGDNLTVTVNANASGKLTMKLNDEIRSVNYTGGDFDILFEEMPEGNYTLTVTYSDENGNYLTSSANATFSVTKKANELTVETSDIEEGQDAVFNVTATMPNGSVNLTIGGKTYTANITDSKATFTISNLTADTYEFTVSTEGDKYYASASANGTINVKSTSIIINAPDLEKYYGGSERFVVNVTDKDGNPMGGLKITIILNGRVYNRTLPATGVTTMAVSLNPGNYTAEIIFEGNEEYSPINTTSNIIIKPTITADDVDKVEKAPEQFVATFTNSEGKLLTSGKAKFNINGVMYERNINSQGQAKLNLNLGPNTYVITSYNPVTNEQSANIVKINSRFANHSDVTKYYRNGTQYYITLIGDDGNHVGAGEVVTFNINGVFYNRTTNENGTAKLNINLYTGDYILTAIYKGCMVSNNIKVLPIMTAKDITMSYRDGTQFKATLVDGQGNPFVNETITFNINGVFYNRTTKAGGVASLNINLIPGEYIITSFYGQFAIANTIIIKSQ